MESVYLCLDVGGTEIKAAPVNEYGVLLASVRHFPARAKEAADCLMEHFCGIINEIRGSVSAPAGVRLAFPGPFDYEQGICLLQGLDKYDALYGVNLKRNLSERLKLPAESIRFANDAAAFALGEMGFGPGRNAGRSLFICIGTGCGSTFGTYGVPAPRGTYGVPDSGYLYDAPFLDGCIDDYLSRRGLMKLSEELTGTALDGRMLAQEAAGGSREALLCFRIFGERIRDALAPFLNAFRPEVLCFGGQIMRSSRFFLSPVEEYCAERGILLYLTEDTSIRTLQGLTRIRLCLDKAEGLCYDIPQ